MPPVLGCFPDNLSTHFDFPIYLGFLKNEDEKPSLRSILTEPWEDGRIRALLPTASCFHLLCQAHNPIRALLEAYT